MHYEMEDNVGKASNVGAGQSGSGDEDWCQKKNIIINPQEEKEAQEPIKAVLLKEPQNLRTPKKVDKESIPTHKNETHEATFEGTTKFVHTKEGG